VATLTRDLGNPTTLREVGAKEEDLPALAEAAFADVCTGGNPRTATLAEIEELYRSVY
jgi:lactaldehyde reductase